MSWRERLEATQSAGTLLLGSIHREHGDSQLYRHCLALWTLREDEAYASVFHGDFENAIRILERGVFVLEQAPGLVQRAELPLDDVMQLLACA